MYTYYKEKIKKINITDNWLDTISSIFLVNMVYNDKLPVCEIY